MHILFTCSAGSQQHLNCLLPMARAARESGDEVAIASGEDRRPVVAALGFRFFPLGLSFDALVSRSRDLLPGYRLGGEHEELRTFPHFFARLAAPPAADSLVATLKEFRADLLVHEAAELGGPLAASVRGIPFAGHCWGPPVTLRMAELAGSELGPLWRDHGLEPHPRAGLFEHVTLGICPPLLSKAWEPAPGVVQLVRPESAGPLPAAGRDDWAEALPRRPIVHVSFGTAAFGRQDGLLRWVAGELADLDLNLVITGPKVSGLPPNSIHRMYIPHAQLMPLCDVVITHGGSGTVLSALEHRVPLLVIPQGGDQYRMAAGVEHSGAGIVLRRIDLAGQVRRRVLRLVNEDSFRSAARRAAGEISAMPAASQALSELKRRLFE